jgi:ribosome maturation factor RimP
MADKRSVASVVWDIAKPVCDGFGVILWDVEFVKEGADFILRITIDKEGGVTIDDCEKVNRAIDPLLDEADPIEVSYKLEVSSPGIERALSRPEHFAASVGADVELSLYAPYEGSRKVRGTLAAYDAGDVTVRIGETDVTFKKADVAKVRTVFEW